MLDDKLNQAKEYINANKKNIIIVGVLIVAAIISYDVFWSGNNNTGAGQTRKQLKSVGVELKGAGTAVAESQRITSEIRQTNTDIQQSNNTIRSTIDESRAINQSSAELIADSKSIIRQVRERNQK
jgi:predicted negative regulator of RcsB-dependent stress response